MTPPHRQSASVNAPRELWKCRIYLKCGLNAKCDRLRTMRRDAASSGQSWKANTPYRTAAMEYSPKMPTATKGACSRAFDSAWYIHGRMLCTSTVHIRRRSL